MTVLRPFWLICSLLGAFTLATFSVTAAPRPVKKPPQPKLPDLKTPEDKLQFLSIIRAGFPALRTTAHFNSDDLDTQLERYIEKGTSTPLAPIVDDEMFVRRLYIDATGKFPTSQQIKDFVADKDPKKRAVLIDKLLETDEFARKWARYWRTVIFYDSEANKNSINPQALEDWFFQGFKQGHPWDRMVAEMVSASPKRIPNVKPQDNGHEQNYGPNNFILAAERKPEIIASMTARIFMGLSIGCAECHDHPFDQWKREQFHEMATFFAPGKYYMTDQNDPTEKSVMTAKFLLGEEPPPGLKPDQLRVAVAAYLIYNPDNYWFARAYVNRIWNELIGDGFYSVDSLGPDKDVVHQLVANRLGATFRSNGFDTKWLFRVIFNTRTYQRQIGTITNEADLFTAVRPARLRSYEVADNVTQLIGENGGVSKEIASTFEADPSIPQRELEGSIQQSLLLMNNGTLASKLQNSELQKRLVSIKDNKSLIQEAFLSVLARKPTDPEIRRYEQFLKESANRNEGINDILWILMNSAEFVTKR